MNFTKAVFSYIKLDYLTGMESESNRSPDYYSRLNLRNVKKYSKSKIKSESWASDYQKNR